MLFLLSVVLLSFLSVTFGQSTGSVRLYRNGVADTSQSWSSGIVQIYYGFSWGNICDDFYFGSDEADVICHQLGYTGASSYSNTGSTSTWGSDPSVTKLSQVSCTYSSYLAITQCSYRSTSTCTSDDVIVSCYSTRIWDSPSTGDIRLTGGTYSNEGLLEVYCNGEWGTVCDDYFYSTEARVACRQLGYNYYDTYDQLSLTGDSSQPIFLRYLSGCTSSDDCLTECGGCPSSGIGGCSHSEDITLECEYSSSFSDVYTTTSDTCIYYDSTITLSSVIGIVVGSIIAFIVCLVLIICIPICICLCLGVGIGAASRGTTRSTVVAQPPGASATVVQTGATNQQQQQPYYPADPTMGTKTDAPPGYYNQPPPPDPYGGPQQPPPGYPPQGQPPQGYPPQGQPPQGYPPQGQPPQGYPPQGQPPQGYAYPPPA